MRNLLQQTLQKVESGSTFRNDCSNFFSIAACNTPFAASLAMLWFLNSSTHAQQPSGETTKMADALNEVEDDETMTESQEYGGDESTKLSDTDKKKLIEALKHHP